MEGDGARVLVVDDDASVLDSTLTMLRVSGFEVRGAHDGALGLEEVITFRPDVVVFDFWMPVAGGRDLLQGIREVARARVGLVAMSGTPEVEDWCGRVGVSQFVRKPFERKVLAHAVERALEDARTSSSRMRAHSAGAGPVSRRLRVDRAVLVVGERDRTSPVRFLLREGPRPMQVAVVSYVEGAVRALGTFMLDAIAVLGASAVDDAHLPHLVAEARARNLPVVLDRPSRHDLGAEGVTVCADHDARSVVDELLRVVAGPRAIAED